jgi:DNA-binding CsgD family transcriptional regulator
MMNPLSAILMGRATWELGVSRFAAAETTATEALELAGEIGQEGVVAVCTGLLARAHAPRGREEECRRLAAEALAMAAARSEAHPQSAADAALAQLDLAQGRAGDALLRLQGLFTAGHPVYRYAVVDDLVEAAAAAGRPDEALEAVAAWQRWAASTQLPIGDVTLARARALLAAPADADARFQEALAAHERVSWPFGQARTELAYGELLRRARRRTEARVQLRAALERFEALGAAPWADRAAAELRATGETARKRDASTLDQLTPQELQIARLVAEGGRNRDIAARLFLSPKTVEYHLRKIFQKLDIGARADLIRLVSSGDAAQALVGAA